MRQKDTTNPIAHQRAQAIFKESGASRTFEVAKGFRIHLCGLYDAEVGPEWNSDGRYECDYLHHIDFVFSGQRQVVHGSRVLDLKPGMAYFLPGKTPLQRRCRTRGRVLFIKFRCEWFPGVDPLLDWAERVPMLIGAFDKQEWQPWLSENRKVDINAILKLHSQVENYLATILPPMDDFLSRHIEKHTRFAKIFKIVEEKLGADLRISTLAKTHGTNPHAFSMAFSNCMQMTPKEYLNQRLNQEATQLMTGTDMNIKEIAYQLRFSDEFYFSRFFNKMNGLSPSQYRALFRAEK
ncbi:MAG: AraC family transcriptional regulator [Kiritimatiellae bacterium]|jgi:AraC-like DNA-binding protein|nr:AraC family transcriptional regulator [Kiritimatiellia bacterium]